MNDLLTKETLAAVIAASPDLPGQQEEAAQVLAVLKNISAGTKKGAPYYSAIAQDIATDMTHVTSEIYTGRAIGIILRSMGLSGYRTKDGYRYAWTPRQLEILSAAFEKEVTRLKVT